MLLNLPLLSNFYRLHCLCSGGVIKKIWLYIISQAEIINLKMGQFEDLKMKGIFKLAYFQIVTFIALFLPRL
jgi:hypothetical protein